MRNIIVILLLLVCLPVNAATVHRWQKEISDECSEYLTTNNTRKHLYACLIGTTRDPYFWRKGWERPVEANVMPILNMYQPEILKLSDTEKSEMALQYQQNLPYMYALKMQKQKKLNKKFTQEDIERLKP